MKVKLILRVVLTGGLGAILAVAVGQGEPTLSLVKRDFRECDPVTDRERYHTGPSGHSTPLPDVEWPSSVGREIPVVYQKGENIVVRLWFRTDDQLQEHESLTPAVLHSTASSGSTNMSAPAAANWEDWVGEMLRAEGYSNVSKGRYNHVENGSFVRLNVMRRPSEHWPASPFDRYIYFLRHESTTYQPGMVFPSLPSGVGLGRARDKARPSASLHFNLPGPGSLQIRVYTDDVDVETRWDGKGGKRDGAFVREPAPPGWEAKFEGITRWVVALACGDRYVSGTERFGGREVGVIRDPRGAAYFALRDEATRAGWTVSEDRSRAIFTLRRGARSWTVPLGSDRARDQNGAALQLGGLAVARGEGRPYVPMAMLSALSD